MSTTPGMVRGLRNAALTFQARTLETMLGYNPHSPLDAKRPGERSEPEQFSPGNTQDTTREPSGNTQGATFERSEDVG